jgi:ParB-like chromosome segregation protein Spo0J
MADPTYVIIDGVRRAKACQLLGRTAIPAEIIDDEGNPIGLRDLPIDSLLSLTKDSIDVST